MKRLFLLLLTSLAFTQANAADVGVSVSVGQPGFFGQINIGDFAPQPQIIYPQPVVIRPVPVYAHAEPIYLHVPPGQAKKWSAYCGRYNACGRPVYFVRDSWYNDVYVPKYREHREHEGRHGDDDDQGGHERGHGNEHGKHGHGHGHDD